MLANVIKKAELRCRLKVPVTVHLFRPRRHFWNEETERARKEKEGRKQGGGIDCTEQQRCGYVTVRATVNAA